eukprot:5111776-Prymnesium_polylepis.1
MRAEIFYSGLRGSACAPSEWLTWGLWARGMFRGPHIGATSGGSHSRCKKRAFLVLSSFHGAGAGDRDATVQLQGSRLAPRRGVRTAFRTVLSTAT